MGLGTWGGEHSDGDDDKKLVHNNNDDGDGDGVLKMTMMIMTAVPWLS